MKDRNYLKRVFVFMVNRNLLISSSLLLLISAAGAVRPGMGGGRTDFDCSYPKDSTGNNPVYN